MQPCTCPWSSGLDATTGFTNNTASNLETFSRWQRFQRVLLLPPTTRTTKVLTPCVQCALERMDSMCAAGRLADSAARGTACHGRCHVRRPPVRLYTLPHPSVDLHQCSRVKDQLNSASTARRGPRHGLRSSSRQSPGVPTCVQRPPTTNGHRALVQGASWRPAPAPSTTPCTLGHSCARWQPGTGPASYL